MPGYRKHISSAIWTFPLVTLLYKGLLSFMGGTPLTWEQVSTGFILYILSSEAPDIDHKQAYANRLFFLFFWILLTLVIFRTLFVNFYYHLPPTFDPVIEEVFLLVSLAGGGLISFASFKLLPVHRGPVHTVLFGFVYSVVLVAAYWYLFENASTENSALSRMLFIFLCSFIGFLNHLILDKFSSKLKKQSS
ncbi:MAG TPA: metal-dependent hydrolase [Thermotogota bacterium]|nr:metal-dependent hydrolase [Thermotogota bacterium]